MLQTARQSKNEEIKRKLHEQRIKVEKAIAQHLYSRDGSFGEWQERDSPAEIEMREVDFNQLQALQTQLRNLEWAESRLHDNSFGICIDCGKRISEKRLLNDPCVTRCINCQKSTEDASHQPSL